MDGIYTTILILGLILISTCIIIIFLDRKNFYRNITLATEKEAELREIIADAEYMIEELSKLSDSILNGINDKKSELDTQISNVTTQINQIEKRTQELNERINFSQEIKQESKQDSKQDIKQNNVIKSKINEKYKKVANLLEQGVNEATIAHTLSIGIGEVQLVSMLLAKNEASN